MFVTMFLDRQADRENFVIFSCLTNKNSHIALAK